MKKLRRIRYYKHKNIIIIFLFIVSITIGYAAVQTKLNIFGALGLVSTKWEFDYTGGEQVFTVPQNGVYRLETWGASGGYAYDSTRTTGLGGYGGYSRGEIYLSKYDKLYINVGGEGESNCQTTNCKGGYNGGSNSSKWAGGDGTGLHTGGGGGATHIANISGELYSLTNYKGIYSSERKTFDSYAIYIVSGGGGGGDYYTNLDTTYYKYSSGGSAGGYIGVSGINDHENENISGTQNSGYLFGKAGTTYISDSTGGSGGGWFGGTSSKQHVAGAGGSSYIGSSLLDNKAMYCYGCLESNDEQLKTIRTTNVSSIPTTNYVKLGNGYARITLVSTESEIVKNNYVVTFNPRGGNIEITNKQVTYTEEYGELPTPIKDGYLFLGWYTDITDGIKVTSSTHYSLKGNTTLYAHWAKLGEIWNYDYLNNEQTFIVPADGIYLIEAWGAQGGSINEYIGGYGAYTTGHVFLNKYQKIYINTGGSGNTKTGNDQLIDGGYNGGGSALTTNYFSSYINSSGGGATHIAFSSGILPSFGTLSGEIDESKLSKILSVAAGGGGGSYWDSFYRGQGGSGGGITGNNAIVIADNTATKGNYGTGALQTSAGYCLRDTTYNRGQFGLGANSIYTGANPGAAGAGGGGGFFGGGGGCQAGQGGGGGSSYIANSKLTNKAMYCYNCTESNIELTRTISTTNVSETPTSYYAKMGNGYARITYIGNEQEYYNYYVNKVLTSATNYYNGHTITSTTTIDITTLGIPNNPLKGNVYIKSDGRVAYQGLNNNQCIVKRFDHTDVEVLPNINDNCSKPLYKNLVVNGYGEYGDNTNFSFYEYDNNLKSFHTIVGYAEVNTDTLIPINANRKYYYSMDGKSVNRAGTYVGLTEYDIDKYPITAERIMYVDNTLTRLTRNLNPGDNVVYLENTSNWANTSNLPYYVLGLTFWNYKDSTGYQYPTETYSRNVYHGLYSYTGIDKTNNTITLTNSWTGPTIPAGTYLSQPTSGNSYNYILDCGGEIPTSFTQMSNTITGTITNNLSFLYFRPGTKYVSPLWLLRYYPKNSDPEEYWFKNIIFEEIDE